jgi:lipopolysaccharide transport system ATP-binding protein
MGRNGAGKSTLLQLITSVLEPSAGEINVRGRISALLELGAGFNPELTGRENVLSQAVLMGMTRREMLAKLPEIENFADIGEYIDQPVRSYSSGMFVRLAFAMFISVEPDILIIDEALAVGDAAFQEKCFRKLKEFKEGGKTFLLVSHSASMITQLCDRVLIIEDGMLYFEGEPQSGLVEYGKLMFGAQVPNDPETALKRVISKKRLLPDGAPTAGQEEWIAAAFDGEERFASAIGYNKNEIRSGIHTARIVDYKMLVGGNAVETPMFGFLDEISLYVKVFYGEETLHPRLAFTISTLAGILVYDVNTEMRGYFVPSGRKGETAVYRYTFNNVLSKGSYVLSLWLVAERINEISRLDARESSIIIESVGSDTFRGLVDLKADIEHMTQER